MEGEWPRFEVVDVPVPKSNARAAQPREKKPPRERFEQDACVSTCPNCDKDFVMTKAVQVYCPAPARCYDEADAVRYARKKYEEYAGQSLPMDIQAAIDMNRHLAWETTGYDKRERKKADAQRLAVFERDKGRCVECGRIGSEVDHIDGTDSNRLDNLQLLCVDCHEKKTYEAYGYLLDARREREDPDAEESAPPVSWEAMTPEEQESWRPWLEHMVEYEERVNAPEPLRPCDVPDWDWKGWIREHKRPID